MNFVFCFLFLLLPKIFLSTFEFTLLLINLFFVSVYYLFFQFDVPQQIPLLYNMIFNINLNLVEFDFKLLVFVDLFMKSLILFFKLLSLEFDYFVLWLYTVYQHIDTLLKIKRVVIIILDLLLATLDSLLLRSRF